MTLAKNLSPVLLTLVNNLYFHGVVDTFQKKSKKPKFFPGVNDTAVKLFTGVNDTADNFISKFFSFFAGVVDTADKHSFANISANFRKKFEMVLMGYPGARGTLIYEKKPESKSLVSYSL
jgi:hypothetical protein